MDPETSVKVLKSQLQDTKAKMIICSNHSRKVVFETLKNLDFLGKVKVIVLELAQPKPDQDVPIDVDETNFVFYQDFLKRDGQIQPPSLQNGPLKGEEVFIIFWSSGTTGNPKGTMILLEVFPPVENTSKKVFDFSLFLFYATFQCGPYSIFKQQN